jgi:hypothetical protein
MEKISVLVRLKQNEADMIEKDIERLESINDSSGVILLILNLEFIQSKKETSSATL